MSNGHTATIASIRCAEPFQSLFPIDMPTLGKISDHMKANGFDVACPLIIWSEGNVLIDGHTRLLAARECGISSVPVIKKHFASEDAAVEYAIHCQRDRRNLSDADVLRWVAELDRRKARGGDRRSAEAKSKTSDEVIDPDPHKRTSSAATADLIGVSRSKVDRSRLVLSHAPEDIKDSVLNGQRSINAAANIVREMRKQDQPVSVKRRIIVKEEHKSGLEFATMAISQLERIHPTDIHRQPAFDKVERWIKENR